MNVIFWILTGINTFVFLYALLKDVQYLIEHKIFKKAFLSGANLAKKMEEDIKSEKNKPSIIGKKESFNEKQMILTSLVGLFKFQMIIVLLFGFKFSLESIVKDIYTSGFYLSNALTILIPILFYWSIIITIYLFWKGLILNSKLPEHKKKKTRLSDTLIILVVSSVGWFNSFIWDEYWHPK